MSADADLNPFARGHVGSMPVASKPAASSALGPSALGPPALGPPSLGPPSLGPPSLGPPSALYTEPAGEPSGEPSGEPFAEPAKPFVAEKETDGDLVDLARRVAGFVAKPEPAAAPGLDRSLERALERALRAFLLRARDRFVRRLPRAIREELGAETRDDEAPDALARWVSTLARGLAELDGTGSELAQHERVMAVLRPALRRSLPLHVLLAPWVRASDVRADIADDPDGRGVRILAYALYDAAQADFAAHVVFHDFMWYLIVCATYSKSAWHDVYGARLHVAPTPRELDFKPVSVFEPLAASIACEVGLVHLRLARTASVRLARVPALSANDRLSLAMHLLSAGRTMPIVPGTHVLAGLREFSATEGNDLLRLIEDPYERVFTTLHAKMSASARSVGVVGEQYGRVLLSLLRMFTSTDLEEGGELGAILRATPNGHFRVVAEIPEADLAVLRSALPTDETDSGYMQVLHMLVTGKPFNAKEAVRDTIKKFEAISKELDKNAKSAATDANNKARLNRWVKIGGLVAGTALSVGVLYFYSDGVLSALSSLGSVASDAAGAAAAAADAAAPAAFEAVAGTPPQASSWIATIANFIGYRTGIGLGVTAVSGAAGAARSKMLRGHLGGASGVLGAVIGPAWAFITLADLALNDTVSKELGFDQMASLAPLVPATELAYHVTRAVIDATRRRLGGKDPEPVAVTEAKPDKKSDVTCDSAWSPSLDTCWEKDKNAKNKQKVKEATELAGGLPNVHEEIDGMRGLYWMLVAMFVRLQIARIDEIAHGYKRHVGVAVRGRSDMLGVAIKTNATREPGAKQFPLDAIPIGAFAYSRGEGGAIAAMRRTGLDTFDEFSVREHDRAVRLEQNTALPASELAHRVKGGERVYGPIYDADELLRKPRREPVFATTRVRLEFDASKLSRLPVSFAPRTQHARSVESYQRFVFALRERERQKLASELGSLAAQVAPFVTAASALAVGYALSPLTTVVAASVYAASAFGPSYATTSSWFRGTEANKRALYEAAQREYERSPGRQAALSESLRSALYSVGVETAPEGAGAPEAAEAKNAKPLPVPFDYRSIRAETMQSARAALGLAAAVMEAMPGGKS